MNRSYKAFISCALIFDILPGKNVIALQIIIYRLISSIQNFCKDTIGIN